VNQREGKFARSKGTTASVLFYPGGSRRCGECAGWRAFISSAGPVPSVNFWIASFVAHRPCTSFTRKADDFAGSAGLLRFKDLAYLHSFVWIEAIRSFHHASDGSESGEGSLGLSDAYVWLTGSGNGACGHWSERIHSRKLTDSRAQWFVRFVMRVSYADDGHKPLRVCGVPKPWPCN